jgi:hypothetical protein
MNSLCRYIYLWIIDVTVNRAEHIFYMTSVVTLKSLDWLSYLVCILKTDIILDVSLYTGHVIFAFLSWILGLWSLLYQISSKIWYFHPFLGYPLFCQRIYSTVLTSVICFSTLVLQDFSITFIITYFFHYVSNLPISTSNFLSVKFSKSQLGSYNFVGVDSKHWLSL